MVKRFLVAAALTALVTSCAENHADTSGDAGGVVQDAAADAGCDVASRDAGQDAGLDASFEHDGGRDAAADAGADGGGADGGADGGPHPPVTCAAGEACNDLLDADGRCPGDCVPQRRGLWCRGTVVDALCYRVPPADRVNIEVTVNDLRITPVKVPQTALPGDRGDVVISVKNVAATRQVVPFSFKNPSTWEMVSASFAAVTQIDLDAGSEIALQATMRAVSPDAFSGGLILTLVFDQYTHPVYSRIEFPPDGNLPCGGRFFPPTWCADPNNCYSGRDFYMSAVCCDDVFYPGSTCCTDADCGRGACFDGRCVTGVPQGNAANTLPHGSQRVLIVSSDRQPRDLTDLCRDRYADFKDEFGLDEFEAYVGDLVRKRVRRAPPAFSWYVITGLAADDFIKNGQYDFLSFMTQLEQFLQAKGCIGAFADYDKVVMQSPKVEIGGFAGVANADGRIAATYLGGMLIAHEVSHTFGASDLYLDLGGQFQYLFDLMGNNLGTWGPAEDGVMWGETGLGDADRNGVIDLVEFAEYPEALEVREVKAYLTYKGTLEVHASIGAREGGRHLRVILPSYMLTLPEYGLAEGMNYGTAAVFDSTQIDVSNLHAGQVIKVGFAGSYGFTGRDFSRRTLTLDTVQDVALETMR